MKYNEDPANQKGGIRAMTDIMFIQCPFNKRPGVDRVYPLGIGYLMQAVREEGFTFDFFDCAIVHTNASDYLRGVCEQLRAYLKQHPARLLAISAVTTGSILALGAVIAICKEQCPGTPVILGGPLPSIESTCQVFFRHYPIDGILRGDGENVIPLLIRHVREGGCVADFPYATLPGKMGPLNILQDIDRIPIPYRDPVIMERYGVSLKRGLFSRKKSATMITSRGCPCSCFYCVSGNLRNKRFHKRSWASIAEEVKLLTEGYGVDNIVFYDDCFFPNPLRVNEDVAAFLAELRKRSCTDFIWQTELRADVVSRMTPETIMALYAHGCRQINIGIETPDPEFLKYLGKTAGTEDVVLACRKILQYAPKMLLGGTFIVGGPNVNEEKVRQTQAFATSLGIHFVNFFPLELHPGTPLYRDVCGDSDEWYQTIVHHKNNSQCLLYENPAFPEAELKKAVAQAYEDFYSEAWECRLRSLIGDQFEIIRNNLQIRQSSIQRSPQELRIK